MNITIAINPSTGKFHTPEGFTSDAVATQWLIDLANYLKEHSVTVDQPIKVNKAEIEKNWEQGLVTNYLNNYYFPSTLCDEPVLTHLTIVEIDTLEPWIITEYDGAEVVETLPDYRQVDEFNYHEIV